MIAVLSDIHANLTALRAVLARAEALGCTRFLSLGDVVGYGPQPGECIELLASVGARNVMGNHDAYLLGLEDCSRSRTVTEIIKYHRSLVTQEQLAWLARSVATHTELDALLVHGSYANPRDGYLYRVSEQDIPAGYRMLFSGHTHVQALLHFGGRSYCNPGSVGQPRDGDPRAAFAVWDGGLPSLHRVDYDVAEVVELIAQSPLPASCGRCLLAGTRVDGTIDRITATEIHEEKNDSI